MNDANKQPSDDYADKRVDRAEPSYHVVPYDEDEWAVRKEGEIDPESTYTFKSEAVNEAKQMAEAAGTIVYIHNENGEIEEQQDYQS